VPLRYCGLQKTKNYPKRNSTAQLQRIARERADDEARRIPWQRLFDARNQYIDWQEFYLWVRSILEVEGSVPDWLAEILNDRCPGFLRTEKDLRAKAPKNRPLLIHLEDWIDEHIFGFAKQEGWFSAITYYAIRDPRYQRAEVCWSECVARWENTKPIQYPLFEEWKDAAAQCDDTARLLPDVKKARASAKLVAPDRLADAVSRWIDWEAFAYWARSALESGSGVPKEVARELERRCPGFLAANSDIRLHDSAKESQDWHSLMAWIADHDFQDATAEGWFNAILIQARSHPRAIRTMEYADHCDEVWSSETPEPYPLFEDWRRAADSYVDLDD
jgi:hypothetical protein